MSDRAIIKCLEPYSEVVSYRRGRYLSNRSIFNVNCHYCIHVHAAIPSYLQFGKFLARLCLDRQQHTCRKCNLRSQREQKLSTTEKECLGIVWAVGLFQYYFYGPTFELQTDHHSPLVWLNQVCNKSRKLLRWSITLQEYDMVVEHKSGKQNCNVDALSKV